MYNYSAENITLIADPKVLAISIIENDEEMIDLRKQDIIVYGPSAEVPDNQDYFLMRKAVYEKLLRAQDLLPQGIKFCLYEAYRSLSLQKMLFDNHYRNIKSLHPDWQDEEIFIETTKLVSPVINLDGSVNVPPHSTGGAIDVYLTDENGNELDMGIHPKDAFQDIEGDICLTNSKTISNIAKKNRTIMSKALTEVGFVNYPTEYWHWSYGDRYWAFITNQLNAIYNSYNK